MARQRVIDRLRKLFPEENFRWDYRWSSWIGKSFYVYGESHAYNESAGTHIVKYVRSDTHELIDELGCKLEKVEQLTLTRARGRRGKGSMAPRAVVRRIKRALKDWRLRRPNKIGGDSCRARLRKKRLDYQAAFIAVVMSDNGFSPATNWT